MNVVLIGYRGAGKTEVGKGLAKKLGRRFVDTDELIAERSGKKIAQIFREHGESGFRKLEKKVVKEVSGMDGLVIACGGGVPVNKENLINLKKNGIIILLKAPAQKIFERIKDDRERPPLTEKNAREEIIYMLEKRNPIYEGAADFTVDAGHDNLMRKVAEITAFLKKRGALNG